jgi:hypothetical protein
MAPLRVTGFCGASSPNQSGERIGTVVVDRAGQHDGRAFGLCGGDAVVQHRQHQLRPVAVAGRVDRMHDDRATLRGFHDGLPVHRVAAQPGDAVLLLRGLRHAALECPHRPTRLAELPSHLAADAACRAQNQNRIVVVCHEMLQKRCRWLNSGSMPVPLELPNIRQQLYICV